MEQIDPVVAGAVVHDDGPRAADADVDAVAFVVIGAIVGHEDVRTGGTVAADAVLHDAAVAVIADDPQRADFEGADVLVIDAGAFEPRGLAMSRFVERDVVQVGVAQEQIVHLHPRAPHDPDAAVGAQVLHVVVGGQGSGGRR